VTEEKVGTLYSILRQVCYGYPEEMRKLFSRPHIGWQMKGFLFLENRARQGGEGFLLALPDKDSREPGSSWAKIQRLFWTGMKCLLRGGDIKWKRAGFRFLNLPAHRRSGADSTARPAGRVSSRASRTMRGCSRRSAGSAGRRREKQPQDSLVRFGTIARRCWRRWKASQRVREWTSRIFLH